MRHLFFYFIVFGTFVNTVSCNRQGTSDNNKYVDLDLIYKQNVQDSTLATGWYYILENDNGFKRQLDKADNFYFIDPKPIIVKEHIESVRIETDFEGKKYLTVQILRKYTHLWADATEKAIGKQLGFVIDDKLIFAPIVNARIEGGKFQALWGYDKDELENFKKKLIE